MPQLNEYDFYNFLNDLQKKFLCCYPLHCIEWQNFPKDLTWDDQKTLMNFTYNSSLNKEFPIKLSYQLNFLKKLLVILEETCADVHDAVYESYCEVQQNLSKDCTEKYAFKHYILGSEMHISLKESKSFVAEGTTGLCSWQASLALADFLMAQPHITNNKTILELGAGTGLCGFILLKMCKPMHLLLTDGSRACVDLMCENIRRNFNEVLKEEGHRFKIANQTVECVVAPWELIQNVDEISLVKPDIILAADVVYDDSCFVDLSHAINHVFQRNKNNIDMYLSATVRNEHTLNDFLKIMNNFHFNTTELNVVTKENSLLCWDRTTPVKILKISR